jgi:hypothetical protein
MVKGLIFLLVLVCFGIVWRVVWHWRSEHAPKSDRLDATLNSLPTPEGSSWGICKKCGERRVIINAQAGLCAVCWASSGTKGLA